MNKFQIVFNNTLCETFVKWMLFWQISQRIRKTFTTTLSVIMSHSVKFGAKKQGYVWKGAIVIRIRVHFFVQRKKKIKTSKNEQKNIPRNWWFVFGRRRKWIGAIYGGSKGNVFYFENNVSRYFIVVYDNTMHIPWYRLFIVINKLYLLNLYNFSGGNNTSLSETS